jgi:hypothetical protein
MPKTLEWVLDRSAELVEADAKLLKQDVYMERMESLEDDLPPEAKQQKWWRTWKPSDPYDALNAGVRVFAKRTPEISVDPITVYKASSTDDATIGSKVMADEWEKNLDWNFQRMQARAPDLMHDIVHDSLVYGRMCFQLIDLERQIKMVEKLGRDAGRQKTMLRYGRFAAVRKNPKSVHVQWSEYMPERVLLVEVKTAQQIVDFWGDKARALTAGIEDKSIKPDDHYSVGDYTDLDTRCVYCVKGETEEFTEGGVIKILKEPNKDGFLNWAIAQSNGGRSLLWGLYASGAYDTAVIIGSIMASDVLATWGRSSRAIIGPGARDAQEDHTKPGGDTLIEDPRTTIVDLASKGLIPGLRELYLQAINQISQTTVARVLQSVDANPGEAYSSFSLRYGAAIESLDPYKVGAERLITELVKLMLLNVEKSGVPLEGYGEKGKTKQKYTIDSEDIDIHALYLNVSLKASLQSDRMQLINMATMLKRDIPDVSWEFIAGLLDIADPSSIRRQAMKDKLIDTVFAIRMNELNAASQLKIQAKAMRLQAQVAPPPQPGGTVPGEATAGAGSAAGQGFATGEGGTPPAMAGPALGVREVQTGMTQGGGMAQ